MKYTPTLHAIERAQHRLGIEPAQAKRWFYDKMRQARYLFTQHVRGVEQLIYEHEDVRYVVDSRNNVIVTVKPAVDTSILTPVFEREHRRIKREVTRLRSEEHTSELQSRENLVCRLLLEKK